jgi:hypothetical protein
LRRVREGSADASWPRSSGNSLAETTMDVAIEIANYAGRKSPAEDAILPSAHAFWRIRIPIVRSTFMPDLARQLLSQPPPFFVFRTVQQNYEAIFKEPLRIKRPANDIPPPNGGPAASRKAPRIANAAGRRDRSKGASAFSTFERLVHRYCRAAGNYKQLASSRNTPQFGSP